MEQRNVGKHGPAVGALGLGCMGMSEFYGVADDAESIRTIQRALEVGVSMLDTADMYGPFTNEQLVGKAIKGRRDRAFVATKFGIMRDPVDPSKRLINGRPEYVRTACDASLKRLGIDHIDLYYQHRVDVNTPIEETVGAMSELVQAGKVRFLGLSEASEANVRRAYAIYPIAALQNEWSLWSRDLEENGQLEAARDLGVSIVAYSPLGRGFLTGAIKSPDDFASDDFRRSSPRFMGENFQKNLDLVHHVAQLAMEKECTTSQLALAWLLAQGRDVIPIPGTKRVKYLKENVGALEVQLSDAELQEINDIFPKGAASGARYADMSFVNR
jgi:aryl-alcohol dehydrogenase-like predicted oxidoreductase